MLDTSVQDEGRYITNAKSSKRTYTLMWRRKSS